MIAPHFTLSIHQIKKKNKLMWMMRENNNGILQLAHVQFEFTISFPLLIIRGRPFYELNPFIY